MVGATLACFLGLGLATQGRGLVFQQTPERTHESVRIMGGTDALQSFAKYMTAHGKTYLAGSAEFHMRLELFQRRAAEVQHHNSQADRLWTAALNRFSDRSEKEIAEFRGFRHLGVTDADAQETNGDLDMSFDVPDSTDWTNWSSLFIRDQGMCGSCWAVTATTVLAAHSEIHATNRTFSTQQIVDCVPNPKKCGGEGGCEGATVELALQYTMLVGSQQPQEYGGYTATDGKCSFNPESSKTVSMNQLTDISLAAKVHEADANAPGHAFGLYAWQKLASNKERPLMVALATKGPVAISLAANDIMMYSHGIFDSCKDWVLNHAVTAVGYGVDKGHAYWLVQNSWGADWGEGGRIRILRSDNEDENCGTDNKPQDGVACEGETEPVSVCGSCGLLYDSVVPLFRQPSHEH